ncbi:MAG: tellurite resistance TerB family protein [Inhella sp.]
MSFGKLLEGLMQAAGQTAARGSQDVRWEQVGAGAAVGGALGLLLGNKSRKLGGMGSQAVKYGSVAALGYAAWKIYEQHQRNQQRAAAVNPWPTPTQDQPPQLATPELELHSRLMLKAMIAAAKADGHVDDRERGLIEAELQRQNAQASERAWLEQELRRPLDPAEVASAVNAPEQAAEVYLASLLVADETSFMERAYLDELARQLKLPESLKRELEAQA